MNRTSISQYEICTLLKGVGMPVNRRMVDRFLSMHELIQESGYYTKEQCKEIVMNYAYYSAIPCSDNVFDKKWEYICSKVPIRTS